MPSPDIYIEVIVFNYGGALLIKEDAQAPGAEWLFPRVKQQTGETIQQAVVRAVRDVCGIEVEAGKVLNAYDQILDGENGEHHVVLDIEGHYIDGDFDCDHETLMAAWASSYALRTMDVNKGVLQILNKLGFIDWS